MPTFLAPAKINLFLHVTGKLDSGYHTLDSLVAFADIGDFVTLEPADSFSFHVCGPFSDHFSETEKCPSLLSDNLVVRAVKLLAHATQKDPSVKITLTKNLPLAAGLGGGSADAATVVKALLKHWKIPFEALPLSELMIDLGADMPVCLHGRPCRITGIGEMTGALFRLPEASVLLINPGKPCPTKAVFQAFQGPFKEPLQEIPESFETLSDLTGFLSRQENQLTGAAQSFVPEIKSVTEALGKFETCRFARLSGSGASLWGLFENPTDAKKAQNSIRQEYPDWWCAAGKLTPAPAFL